MLYFIFIALLHSLFLPTKSRDHLPNKQTEDNPSKVIYKSIDGGNSWVEYGEGLPVDIAASDLESFQGDLYLSSDKGIFHTSPQLTKPDWKKEYFFHESDTRFFKGRQGIYAVKYRQGLYQKLYSTGIWLPLHLNLKDKSVRTVLEGQDHSMIVGTETGIYRSVDGGQSWTQILEKEIIHSMMQSRGSMLAFGDKGLYRSFDEGKSWDHVPYPGSLAGLWNGPGDRSYILVRKNFQKHEFIQTGKNFQLFESTDGGIIWNKSNFGPPDVKQILGITKSDAYLICHHEKGLSLSLDQGKSWKNMEVPKTMNQNIRVLVIDQIIFIIPTFGC